MGVENGVTDICRNTELLREEAVQLAFVHHHLHTEAWGWTRGLALEDFMWYEQQQSVYMASYTKRLREVWRALDPHQFINASVDGDANFRIT